MLGLRYNDGQTFRSLLLLSNFLSFSLGSMVKTVNQEVILMVYLTVTSLSYKGKVVLSLY
jgi:hypothetical protein